MRINIHLWADWSGKIRELPINDKSNYICFGHHCTLCSQTNEKLLRSKQGFPKVPTESQESLIIPKRDLFLFFVFCGSKSCFGGKFGSRYLEGSQMLRRTPDFDILMAVTLSEVWKGASSFLVRSSFRSDRPRMCHRLLYNLVQFSLRPTRSSDFLIINHRTSGQTLIVRFLFY